MALGLLVAGGSAVGVAAEVSGVRITPLKFESTRAAGFVTMPVEQTGVRFTNRVSADRALTNQVFLNGGGVAAGDVDGDGRCDLYFTGVEPANALYRNLGGWRFEDITASAGVACADQSSSGAALADLDGDGDLDLLVNGWARGTRLFLNDGRGRFTETTKEAGLEGRAASTSLALADIDGDGDLDLYVVNYRPTVMSDEPEKRFRFRVNQGRYELEAVDGLPVTSPEVAGRFTVNSAAGVVENGDVDRLYLNDGHAHFQAVEWSSGRFLGEDGRPVAEPRDWGLSAQFHDLNGDGAPDLYVCNDFQSPDRIWLNDGRGNFRALPTLAIRQTSLFSMGVDVADVDRDGRPDFFVADMLSREHERRLVQLMDRSLVTAADPGADSRPQYSRNTLFLGRGDGSFAEVARYAGIEASEWSWCPVFLDVDLDGFEDLLITTGHARDSQNADITAAIEAERRARRAPFLEDLRLRRMFPRLTTPNVAFRNLGEANFEEVGAAWGFDSSRISHGMALADLDGDGDLDAVINCLDAGALLLRNEAAAPRVAVRLRGKAPNTAGIGATVHITGPNRPVQTQEILSGGRYLSSDEALRVFAVAPNAESVRVEVIWRNGRRSVVDAVPPNARVEIDEAATAQAGPANPTPPVEPFFEDASDRLKHQHLDEPFDDFARQRLLPRRLSTLGPGVSWFDFNSDGWPDVMIGAGRGGRLAVFRNDHQGGFIPQRAGLLQATAETDQTTVLGWRPTAAEAALLIGLSGYEDGRTNRPSVRMFHLMTGEERTWPDLHGESTGPLALADLDGDGDLDAFQGGRVVPGRYPEAAAPRLWRWGEGGWSADADNTAALAGAGLVSSAVFTDLDLDGDPDLVVANEWGPLRVWRNDGGRLSPWVWQVKLSGGTNTPPRLVDLGTLTGWWNSVAAGDFDGDGRLDLVAGNWGLNVRDRRMLSHPLELHFGDADGDGVLELIEAGVDPGLRKKVPVRDRMTLAAAFPTLAERFPNHAAFARASLADVLSAGLPSLKSVSASTLASAVFLQRADHFEYRALPREAQLSPVFGVTVGDLDGDGNLDLFLAQNFFGVSAAESRYDAGLGLWLRGTGTGDFVAVAARDSGLRVEGEGRGAALADYDRDGRLDLLVAQQRGATRLFHNRRATPGLRVRLTGTPVNPDAIGASVRLRFTDGTRGPVQEVHAGSGYWSQDGAGLVVPVPKPPAALEVRWPGGRTSEVPVGAASQEVEMSAP